MTFNITTDNKIRIFLFLGLLSLFSCNKNELVNEMVQFDQSFIPVWQTLYAIEFNKDTNDEVNLNANWQQLRQDWKILEEKFKNEQMDDDWQESFRFIEQWMTQIDWALKRDDLQLAIICLDHVRFEISDLRCREEIDYALDKIWDYEISLSALLDVSREPQLAHLDWDDIAIIINDCNRSWTEVIAQDYNNKLFKMNSKQRKDLENQFVIISVQLNELNLLVDHGSTESIRAITDQLIDNYLEMLSAFGHPVQPNNGIAVAAIKTNF